MADCFLVKKGGTSDIYFFKNVICSDVMTILLSNVKRKPRKIYITASRRDDRLYENEFTTMAAWYSEEAYQNYITSIGGIIPPGFSQVFYNQKIPGAGAENGYHGASNTMEVTYDEDLKQLKIQTKYQFPSYMLYDVILID